MTKRVALTAMAVLFSLLIAFGCWLLTNALLDRQYLSLLDEVNAIGVKEPATTSPGVEPGRADLSKQDIADILTVFYSSQGRRYHDPLAGQLTMEEAIRATKSGLSYLCDGSILPGNIVEAHLLRTNAFLYSVQSDRAAPAQAVATPAYSFWSVALGYREVSVEMTLNAQTGQIWTADIRLSSVANLDDLKALDALNAYEAYLGLSGGGSLKSGVDDATKSYGSQIGITAQKKVGQSGHYEFLSLSVTLTR